MKKSLSLEEIPGLLKPSKAKCKKKQHEPPSFMD